MKYFALFVMSLFILLSACGTLTDDGRLMFRTADPAVSIAFRLLPAPPVPPIEPQILPTITPTPCELVIKGNVSSSGEKIAHSPGQANYENTQIDPAKGEKMFCTLEEAIAEGWRAAQR